MNNAFSEADEVFRSEVQDFLESALTDELKEAGRKKN